MPRIVTPRRTYIEPNRGESAPPPAVDPEQPRKRAKKPARPAEDKPHGPDEHR